VRWPPVVVRRYHNAIGDAFLFALVFEGQNLQPGMPRRGLLGIPANKGLGGRRRPTQVRRRLGAQVLELLRRVLAAEYLVTMHRWRPKRAKPSPTGAYRGS
jgi:hypothetical protein